MAKPFFAELRILPYSQLPKGWAFCDGQLVSINQNQALFSLLGVSYGGDGITNFRLPDLRGRSPVHVDNTHPLGSVGGESTHVLTINEIPAHTHSVRAADVTATSPSPADATFAINTSNPYVTSLAQPTPMRPTNPTPAALTAGHQNMQPYLTLTFIIALQGIYPPRN